jgi:methylenetetrahydrofolate reductase (NADPH)
MRRGDHVASEQANVVAKPTLHPNTSYLPRCYLSLAVSAWRRHQRVPELTIMLSTVLARDLTTAAATDCPAPAPRTSRQQIIDLLADFSIETTPATVARHGGLDLLPAATRVYIAFVPGDDWRNVAAAARQIRAANQTPVPHFPARSITSERMFDAFLRQLTDEAGVDQVLVIGGGLDQPQGPFASSLALLETGLLERYGVRTIGIAGHPEGDPPVRSPGAPTSHAQKLAYARQSPAAFRLVTQFAFDADPVLAWERAIRDQGLPIHVGVPGPATLKTLLSYARLCGIGNSIRVLTRQGGNLLRLARISYPDALVTALAAARADPACRVERLHVYPFGGLVRTARWLSAVQAGAFTLHDDGLGFTVGDAV